MPELPAAQYVGGQAPHDRLVAVERRAAQRGGQARARRRCSGCGRSCASWATRSSAASSSSSPARTARPSAAWATCAASSSATAATPPSCPPGGALHLMFCTLHPTPERNGGNSTKLPTRWRAAAPRISARCIHAHAPAAGACCMRQPCVRRAAAACRGAGLTRRVRRARAQPHLLQHAAHPALCVAQDHGRPPAPGHHELRGLWVRGPNDLRPSPVDSLSARARSRALCD